MAVLLKILCFLTLEVYAEDTGLFTARAKGCEMKSEMDQSTFLQAHVDLAGKISPRNSCSLIVDMEQCGGECKWDEAAKECGDKQNVAEETANLPQDPLDPCSTNSSADCNNNCRCQWVNKTCEDANNPCCDIDAPVACGQRSGCSWIQDKCQNDFSRLAPSAAIAAAIRNPPASTSDGDSSSTGKSENKKSEKGKKDDKKSEKGKTE